MKELLAEKSIVVAAKGLPPEEVDRWLSPMPNSESRMTGGSHGSTMPCPLAERCVCCCSTHLPQLGQGG